MTDTPVHNNPHYSIIRTIDPDTQTPMWDILFVTRGGLVQLSRFDGINDYRSGGLGEGTYFSWELNLQNESQPPSQTNVDGTITLEQKHGSKLQFKFKQVSKHLSGNQFAPVQKTPSKDHLYDIDKLTLPSKTYQNRTDALFDSTVESNQVTFNTVYGPVSNSAYDGLTAFIKDTAIDVSLNPYINDEYDVMIDVESDGPGISKTLSPEQVVYFLETNQYAFYNNTPSGRTYLLADGREI